MHKDFSILAKLWQTRAQRKFFHMCLHIFTGEEENNFLEGLKWNFGVK